MNSAIRRRRLLPPAAAALAVLALLAAACGGGAPAGPGAGQAGGQTPYQQALAYARCMRAHGEPGFPDPTSQGGISFGPVDIHSARYLSANKACEHLFTGAPPTAAQKREHVIQALEFAACMRAHGEPGFPDPTIAAGGAAISFGLGGLDPNAPQVQSAVRACQRYAPPGLLSAGP